MGDIPLKAGERMEKVNKTLITASTSKAGKKMTRRQRQPRAKSGTETSLGNTAAAAAKSEVMKGDKLERQDGSDSQERNHEGRQAWETRRQRQPRAKSGRETSLGDKLAAAAKSEIMKGDKLGKQGGSGSQERSHEARQAGETRWQRQPRSKS